MKRYLPQARTWAIVVLLVVAATLLMGLGASPANAVTQVNLVQGTASWKNGGEFYGNFQNGSMANVVTAENGTFALWSGVTQRDNRAFATLCAQSSEYFYTNTWYNIARIDTYSDHGNDKPLSNQAAYLFHMWNTGTWSEYNYTSAADAGALQLALWHFQDQTTPSGFTTGFTSAMWQKYWNYVDAANGSGWSGIGAVRIMQLPASAPGWTQDQFCELDQPDKVPPITPEPATVGMLLLGCCTLPLPLLRRRKA